MGYRAHKKREGPRPKCQFCGHRSLSQTAMNRHERKRCPNRPINV